MGVLSINKKLVKQRPDIIRSLILWLKVECYAVIGNWKDTCHSRMIHVEGEGIPEGSEIFTIYINEYVPKVLGFRIEKPKPKELPPPQ